MAQRSSRAGWWIAIAGVGLGAAIRAVAVVVAAGGGSDPSSLERWAFAPVSLLIGFGLLRVVRGQDSAPSRRTVDAALLVTGALGLLAWVAIVQPYVVRGSLSATQREMAVAYCVVDLMFAFAIALLVARNRSSEASTSLLCLAVGSHIAANTAQIVLVAHGAQSDPLALLGTLSFYMVIAVAWMRTRRHVAGPDHPSNDVGLLLSVALINGLAVMFGVQEEQRWAALTAAMVAVVLSSAAARTMWKERACADARLHEFESQHAALAASTRSMSAELIDAAGDLGHHLGILEHDDAPDRGAPQHCPSGNRRPRCLHAVAKGQRFVALRGRRDARCGSGGHRRAGAGRGRLQPPVRRQRRCRLGCRRRARQEPRRHRRDRRHSAGAVAR